MTPYSQAQVQNLYATLKDSSIQFHSNYFFTPLGENVIGTHSEKSFIFLNKVGDFFRLYFASSDMEDLQNLWDKCAVSHMDICADYVCRNAIPPSVKEFYGKNFTPYAVFQKQILTTLPPTEPKLAHCDVSPQTLLEDIVQTFDKYTSYIPDISKIEEAIGKSFALVSGSDRATMSYILFDIRGKQSYINFIANRGGKESLKKLWRDFYAAIAVFGAKSVYLWVDLKNEKALRMYDIEGFGKDAMFNFVYRNTSQ